MKKRIMVLANKYPTSFEPTACTFIQQLAREFADLGFECCVVNPLPVNLHPEYCKIQLEEYDCTENGNKILTYHPKYLSLGQTDGVLQKARVRFTTKMYENAVDKIIKSGKFVPDYIYAYFLCPTGVVASRLGKKYNIPAFMEHGEGVYAGDIKYGNERLKKELSGISGAIAVSNQNRGYLADNGIIPPEKITVYPNCFREERFYKMDKALARKHFGWDNDKFIVGLVGAFNTDKGVDRLQKAVEKLDDVYFVCAGKGNIQPGGDRCLFAQSVLQEELVYFYNAIDAFVLPSIIEGSPTVTAEAIGCGCPIISSDRPFNESLCFPDNSIVIDPENVDEIAAAIQKIKDDPILKESMQRASLERSDSLKQNNRMKKIIEFMQARSSEER